MPNVSITIYLNKEDYLKYSDRAEEINAKAREVVKRELNKK